MPKITNIQIEWTSVYVVQEGGAAVDRIDTRYRGDIVAYPAPDVATILLRETYSDKLWNETGNGWCPMSYELRTVPLDELTVQLVERDC